MNRLLLALLAMLAGLVAPVASAQARIGGTGSAEVGAVETLALAAKACASVTIGSEVPACRIDRRDRAAPRVCAVRPRVYIPAVYFGADRAFE